MTLSQITAEICDMICKRSEMGKDFGVILIPEGLIEFIPEVAVLIKELNALLIGNETANPKDIVQNLSDQSKASFLSFPDTIQKQLLLLRDPHGNVQVSMIETERLLIESVSIELKKRKNEGTFKGKFTPVQHFFGYEGRAGFPSAFDAHYCYSLGLTATLLSVNKMSGYMAFVENLHGPVKDWAVGGIPISSLMNMEERKGSMKPVIKKALLNLKDKPFSYFVSQREVWKYQDLYRSAGPMQFFGDESIVLSKPHTLLLRFT